MKTLRLALPLTLALFVAAVASAADDGWVSLFDGRSLDGWQAAENRGTFTVANGELIAHGKRAHLFYVGPVANHDFTNFELQLEVMTKPRANSGVYFHTAYQETGWPAKGYEVQVNNTGADPQRTGGLYAIRDNLVTPVADNAWFTLTLRVEGRHVVTTVNDRTIVDYVEPAQPSRTPDYMGRVLSHGTFALQGHDPGSEVHYRNIRVRVLP